MSNNDEASGSNDPLPNDGNETNFGNLPDNVLHLIFREALDGQNIVAELVDINQQIESLQNRRQRLINERNFYARQMDEVEPRSVMDLQQAVRTSDGRMFDINAHQQLYRGSERFRDEYQRQIDEINDEIAQRNNFQTLLKKQFLFYMMLLKRHR